MKITFLLFGSFSLTTLPVPALSRRLSKTYSMKSSAKDNKYNDYDAGDHDQNSVGDVDFIYYNGGDASGEFYTSEGCMEFGYLEAKMLWSSSSSHGPYQCESIIQDYWVHGVQTIVFSTCDSKWPATSEWAMYAQDCKKGAEKFTMEQMDNCFNVEECKQVGVSAAASVVGMFCEEQNNGLFHNKAGGWIPAKCVQYAEVSCNYDAVETAQRFMEGGVCGHESSSGLDYLDEIHQLCQTELNAMLEAAKLTVI
jgi:hypothetical protein